jgi:hypothetical protein
LKPVAIRCGGRNVEAGMNPFRKPYAFVVSVSEDVTNLPMEMLTRHQASLAFGLFHIKVAQKSL